MWTWLSVSYSSVAPETTLSGGITNVSTSITVGSVTGFPANTPYTLALDYEGATEELVQVNAAAGTTLTVARAIDGTSAASHNAGARVRHVSSARDFADSRSHENSNQGIHGLAPGDVLVGEDAVQTLTNKTLDSPVINSASLTGVLLGSPTFTGSWTGDTAAILRLNNPTDVSPSSTNHAFQIGPSSGANLRMDVNEVMSVNNGAANALFIQADGGNIVSFGNAGADSLTNSYTINGVTASNQFQATRPSGVSTNYSSRITGDANSRALIQADGTIVWGSGAALGDTNLYRSAANVLKTDDSLSVVGALDVTGATTVTNLTATGTVTLPNTVTTTGVVTAATGWAISDQVAINKAGMLTLYVNVTRTGGTITASTDGGIADVDVFTIAPAFRPNAALASATALMPCMMTDGTGDGAGRLAAATGLVELVTYSGSGGTLIVGRNCRFVFNYPL